MKPHIFKSKSDGLWWIAHSRDRNTAALGYKDFRRACHGLALGRHHWLGP